jgi:PAS domain S-box-containing protein
LFAGIDYGIGAVDRDLRYVYANDAALAMVGLRIEDVIGRTPREIFPPELAEVVEMYARRALETGQPVQYEVYYDAIDRWYENRLFPSPTGVTAFFSDITERKQAEQTLIKAEATQRQLAAALRESRDVLSLAMRGGRMGAWSRDLVTGEVWWSRELEEIFGLAPGGFSGTRDGYLQFAHEDDRPAIEKAVQAAVANGTDYVVEFRFRHGSGEWRWMEGRGGAVYDSTGEPLSLFGVGIDITARKEAEQAIADARAAAAADAEHLNVALSAARLGDWRWDAATDVVTMSPRGAEIFGIPPGPHMTWSAMRELLHPDDRERARLAVEHAIATRTNYATEYRLINQGRHRWIAASGRAIYDTDGHATGMLGVVHDISHDRLLVRLDDAARSLSNADDITFTSAAFIGTHLDVNRCAYAVVEDDEDTFVITGNYASGTHSIVGRYRLSQFGMECRRLMRSGAPFVVVDTCSDPRIDSVARQSYEAMSIRAVIAVPILKDRRMVAVMAVHTTTPREWDATEVELVQQVASRCWESLERARVERERVGLLQAAQAANRAKDEFLAMLGHELRNPLSPIVTALQLMRLRGDVTTQRERQVIERQVAHLTRLVDDLLDVSRIARGKVDLKVEIVDLGEVVARAVETASPLLEERLHRLHVDVVRGAALVHGDAARLTQVFSNLLTNAAKYTPQGGRIDVLASTSGSEVTVTVRDTGIGMGPDVLPHVFDAFAQGPQRLDRAQGGLGLGLTIVRSFVERHGGTVTARSEGPGKGSEFVVRLPLSSERPLSAPATRPVARAAASNGIGMRVLIVDDNTDAANMLATALAIKGFEVQTAHDGLEALRDAASFRPELAVLDIGLPVMDGYELADRLRRIPGLEQVRLIAVTGYGQTSDRDRSAQSGFSNHLVKPVDVQQLVTLALGGQA